jgi:NitT/TauT family transport system permease protein
VRKSVLFVLALVIVAAVWELYKWLGPDAGGDVLGWNVLPKTSRNAMPHVWDMFGRLFDTESRSSDRQIWRVILAGVWYSFRLALLGLAIGAVVGVGLAVLMARFDVVRRGLLPYLIISQTVPLIALAPLVASWGGRLRPFGWDWPQWMSVVTLGAFLAFFPVSVGTLRGLESAPATSLELMRSYAASWGQTLRRLRFPAAVPFIVPAFRLAAAAAVVGVVVAEISTGQRGGIGRLVIEYGRQATSDPEKVYTAVFGAAALGLLMALVVALGDWYVMRGRQPVEELST